MKILSLLIFFSFFSMLSAEIDMSQFKESVTLGDQEVSILKAEIIVNKMPGVGAAKKNYLIISLKTDDGKKIRAKYSLASVSFPGCTRRFTAKVTESRGGGCVVRGLPAWAGKGTLVVVHLQDANKKIYKVKATATAMTVH